jgi:hypothetical protein
MRDLGTVEIASESQSVLLYFPSPNGGKGMNLMNTVGCLLGSENVLS